MTEVRRRYATTQDEIVDRVRRIEKRFTKFMEWQGFDTQVARAAWVPGDGGYVLAPSPSVSIQEVLAAIPKDYAGTMVPVKVGEDLLFTVHTPVR